MLRLAIRCESRPSSTAVIWIADAHRSDEKRFVVRADEKLTAFVELELAICLGFKRVVARSGVSPMSDAIGGGMDAGETLA